MIMPHRDSMRKGYAIYSVSGLRIGVSRIIP